MSLLVDLALGNYALLPRVSGLLSSPTPGLARTATATASRADGGDLAGPWVRGRGHRALEFVISIFHSIKSSEVGLVSVDRSLDSIQSWTPNAILEL